jgi:hypothetical protein
VLWSGTLDVPWLEVYVKYGVEPAALVASTVAPWSRLRPPVVEVYEEVFAFPSAIDPVENVQPKQNGEFADPGESRVKPPVASPVRDAPLTEKLECVDSIVVEPALVLPIAVVAPDPLVLIETPVPPETMAIPDDPVFPIVIGPIVLAAPMAIGTLEVDAASKWMAVPDSSLRRADTPLPISIGPLVRLHPRQIGTAVIDDVASSVSDPFVSSTTLVSLTNTRDVPFCDSTNPEPSDPEPAPACRPTDTPVPVTELGSIKNCPPDPIAGPVGRMPFASSPSHVPLALHP